MRRRRTLTELSLTRRELIGGIACGLVSVAVTAKAGARVAFASPDAAVISGSSAPTPHPVVSFFLDQPYLDYTGRELPYEPPRGTRSGQSVAELTEEALRSAGYWL